MVIDRLPRRWLFRAVIACVVVLFSLIQLCIRWDEHALLLDAQIFLGSDPILALNTPTSTKPIAKDRVLVMRTVAPIKPYVLERIYEIEVQAQRSPYDFWLLVDETRNNQTKARLDSYFAKRGSHVPAPPFFPSSEKILLQHFPKLTSYIYNYPEPNFNNKPGLCCNNNIMWQMFTPSFAMFMHSMRKYRFGWVFEDDVNVLGQYQSLVDLITVLDGELDDDVDLAGNWFASKAWGAERRTLPFDAILQNMIAAKVPWKRISDGLQRHSSLMSKDVYEQVGENVYVWAEGLVFPIAWKYNRTFRDLKQLPLAQNMSIHFHKLTGKGKISRAEAVELFLTHEGTKSMTPFTLIFHEDHKQLPSNHGPPQPPRNTTLASHNRAAAAPLE